MATEAILTARIAVRGRFVWKKRYASAEMKYGIILLYRDIGAPPYHTN
jgi:hypothetical protein